MKNSQKLTTGDIIKRFKAVHNNKYDYSKVNYINSRINVNIICPEHGEFEQNPASHWNGIGCKKCNGFIYDKDAFIKKSYLIHKDTYDYSLVDYKNATTKIKIICKIHGIFEQTPSAHYNTVVACLKCSENTKSLDEMLIEFKNVHGERYDYSLITNDNYKNGTQKIKIICKIHGAFEQISLRHANGNGCTQCAIENSKKLQTISLDEVLDKFKEVHGERYDYSLITNDNYINTHESVDIICKKHGIFAQAPHNHYKGNNCPSCSSWGPSKSELYIQEWLDSINVSYISSDRKQISPQELDIYIPAKKLAVEINGIYWHSSKFIEKNYHIDKTKNTNVKDIQLLHFWDYEINKKSDIVKSMIMSRLNILPNKIYARQCEIREINDNNITNSFLDLNHLQGKCMSSIKLGLFYNDTLVSLMTFGKSRFNKNYEWELIRFCNKLNTTVIGGASKLFKYFIRNYADTNIISYADLRYSNGNLYKHLGFTELKRNAPSYFYNGDTVISRYNAQKHKLINLLGKDNFDANLSEKENMKNNNYYRVYDCGTITYAFES